MTKKRKGFFVSGTDTEVGKTFITAGLAGMFLNAGLKVGIMKPVASGMVEKEGQFISEDVEFLKRVLNLNDDNCLINPYCFKTPIAPGVAARHENIVVDLNVIKHNFYKLAEIYDIVIVEGAGGIMSPVTEKYLTNADLAKELDLPVIIVSRPGLGTINHTMLTVEYARKVMNLQLYGIIFNYQNQLDNEISTKTNPEVIKEMSDVKILGKIPYCEFIHTLKLKTLQNFFENRIDIMIKCKNLIF